MGVGLLHSNSSNNECGIVCGQNLPSTEFNPEVIQIQFYKQNKRRAGFVFFNVKTSAQCSASLRPPAKPIFLGESSTVALAVLDTQW